MSHSRQAMAEKGDFAGIKEFISGVPIDAVTKSRHQSTPMHPKDMFYIMKMIKDVSRSPEVTREMTEFFLERGYLEPRNHMTHAVLVNSFIDVGDLEGALREFHRVNAQYNTLPAVKPLTRALIQAGPGNEVILEDLLIANIRPGINLLDCWILFKC